MVLPPQRISIFFLASIEISSSVETFSAPNLSGQGETKAISKTAVQLGANEAPHARALLAEVRVDAETGLAEGRELERLFGKR